MKKIAFMTVFIFLFSLPVASGEKSSKMEWWNNPGNLQVRGYVTVAVGAAQIEDGNIAQARRDARKDGRRQLAMYLGYRLQSVHTEKGVKVQEICTAKVRGAVPLMYHKEGEMMYCLMGLKSQSLFKKKKLNFPDKLMEKRMKEARRRLDKLIEKEKKNLEKERIIKWWEKTGNLKVKGYALVYVGMARDRFNNTAATQRSAELNAKRKMVSFVNGKIQTLASKWDKEMGDLIKKDSLESQLRTSTSTREIVNGSIKGALPLKYKKKDKRYYVLMGMKYEDFFQSLRKEIEANLSEMVLTDAMKSMAEQRLDKLIKKEIERLKKESKFELEKGKLKRFYRLKKVK